jgi:hypothetical protein
VVLTRHYLDVVVVVAVLSLFQGMDIHPSFLDQFFRNLLQLVLEMGGALLQALSFPCQTHFVFGNSDHAIVIGLGKGHTVNSMITVELYDDGNNQQGRWIWGVMMC